MEPFWLGMRSLVVELKDNLMPKTQSPPAAFDQSRFQAQAVSSSDHTQ